MGFAGKHSCPLLAMQDCWFCNRALRFQGERANHSSDQEVTQASGTVQLPAMACAGPAHMKDMLSSCITDTLVLVCVRLEEDAAPQMYCVLCGTVTLLHGSPADPELQQMLHAARLQAAADATVADAGAQQLQCREVPNAAGQSAAVNQHPGIWRRVMAAVIQGSRLQLQSSMNANSSLITGAATNLQQQQVHSTTHTQHTPTHPQPGAAHELPGPTAHELPATATNHGSSLTVSSAEVGQSFWCAMCLI